MADEDDIYVPSHVDVQTVRKGTAGAMELVANEERIHQTYLKMSQSSFMVFARGLTIKSQKGPRLFERVMAKYQRDCFEDLAPNLEALRNGTEPAMRRFWIERTKKGGKDSDLAVVIAWLLAFVTRPFYGQVGAADREQAGIVKERLSDLIHYNKWLSELVSIVGYEIRSSARKESGAPLGKIEIKSADVQGAHGGTPDVLILNELSHIKNFEFAENMMDNASGVAQGMVLIATNAGFINTPAHRWRKNALSDEEWSPWVLEKPAPWHSKQAVNEARKRNSKSRFNRLWQGKWVSGVGDAFDEQEIDKMFCLKGPELQPTPGWQYIGGLDLGISHDHCGLAIVGVNENIRKIRLVYWKRWIPAESKTGKVNLDLVKDVVLTSCNNYRVMALFYDPWQAELMAQQLKKQGINVREMAFQSTRNLDNMATKFKEAVENGVLEAYDDPEGSLRADVGKMKIVEKSYGYRLEATSDETGHADVATSMIMCLPAAFEFLEGSGFSSDDVLVDEDDQELTEEEVNSLPDDLKGIYEMDDEFGSRPVEDYFMEME